MLQDWLLPLTLLPAVGLIIMSTTNLSSSLSGEINFFLHENEREMKFRSILEKKIAQLQLLSLSLFFQYSSCSCFAISGLLGGLEGSEHAMLPVSTLILIILGILGIVCALVLLIIYAFRAVGIKKKQFEILLNSSPS